MRQLKYRIPILILLFAAALAGFFYRSQKTGDASGQAVRTALETPRLPVIWAESCGKRIDVMRGLRAASAEDPAADTLIILPEDRNLTLDIEDGSLQIRGVRYEVRSSDGKDLIERKDVQETSKTERGLSAVLPVENIVRAGSEYQLEIILTTAEMGDVYYYARITMDETGRAAEMLALAEEFSIRNFDYETARENTAFLETNETGDNTTLGTVNLKSNYSQLTYGKLDLTPVGEADLRLLEYNGSMGVLRRSFIAEGKDAENRTVRFRICEDFVMRRGPERLYMMDYTRRMREIFLGGTGCFSGGKIVLGISGDDALQSVTSPEGRFTAFVTTGDLWLADGNRNRCVRVFSFRSGTEPDLRCDYEKYRLRILECTDDGGLLFLAGGYMNRGEHEGETGLCLMRYDSTANTVTELTFIPCSMSPENLISDMDTLAVRGGNGMVYFKLGSAFYGLDPESNEYLVVSSGLRDGSYAVNALQKDIAWQDTPDSLVSPVVHMMNLDTGSKKELNSGAGQILKPVGYIDRDLAVGIAESENTWEINGTVRELPFTAVEIVDDALVSQEHYEEPGYCISDVEVLDSRIHLSRVRKTGEHSFRKAGTDTIVCNVPAEGVPQVASENTELREKTYVIPFPHGFSGKNVRVISSAAVNSSDAAHLSLPDQGGIRQKYIVYGRGKMPGIYSSAGDAVNAAYREMGYVRHNGRMFYCRAATSAIRTLRNPDTAAGALAAARSEGTAKDLYGADLRCVLYFVSRGMPVLAWAAEGDPVVIYAYDQAAVSVFRISDGSYTRVSRADAESLFSEGRNDFCCILSGS